MRVDPPRALTIAEIEGLVRSFVKTAVLLHKAGFDGVELHAAHGYLISQFLNPRSNSRTDEYGGSLENRSRFLAEIVQGIKEATPPEFSIGVKLNSVDFGRRRKEEGGALVTASDDSNSVDEDLEEAVEVAMLLEDLGVDFIEISGGSYESFAAGLMDGKGVPGMLEKEKSVSARTLKREAHFAVFAERISKALSITKVILTGGFVSATAMAESLKTSASASTTEKMENEDDLASIDSEVPHIDMVGLGRALCIEPDLPNLIMSGAVTGAVKLPKLPGGFMDDVFVCGGNIRRMAHEKQPLNFLPRMLVSQEHMEYAMGFAKVAIHKVKHILV